MRMRLSGVMVYIHLNAAARQRLQQLKAEVQKLQSTVNSSAATLLERTEKDLQELLERKQQVEHDKVRFTIFTSTHTYIDIYTSIERERER